VGSHQLVNKANTHAPIPPNFYYYYIFPMILILAKISRHDLWATAELLWDSRWWL